MEKIYLVTGANGHLGSTIINLLLKEKKNIRAFVLENDVLHLDKKVEIIRGNITDKKSIYPLFKDLENKEVIVIHCAGIVTIASKFDQKYMMLM